MEVAMLEGLSEKAKTGIFGHPALQDVLRRAVNLRSDFVDRLDLRLEALARRLNLATRKEVKVLRRQIRELENQVLNLEGQLTQERQRAERAERSLGEAVKTARDAEAKAKKTAAAKKNDEQPSQEA
jgi:chromosome segregation ATPase